MMSGSSAEFLVKKPIVPTEYEAVWFPFYTWFQTTNSLYVAQTECWPQCTVSQLYWNSILYARNKWHLLFYKCFIVCSKASKNYSLMLGNLK